MGEYKRYEQCANAAEYLNQVLYIDNRINAKLSKIAYYRNLATKTSGVSGAGKTGGASRHSRVEYCVMKIVELENAANGDIDELVRLKGEIEAIIRKVERPIYRQLLELRYIAGLKWERVALDMNKSYVHVVHNLYPQALKIIEKILNT